MGEVLPGVFIVRSPVFELLASMFRLQSHERLSRSDSALALDDFDLGLWVDRVRKVLDVDTREALRVFFDYESYLGLAMIRYAWVNNAWDTVDHFVARLEESSPDTLFAALVQTGYVASDLDDAADAEQVRRYIQRASLPTLEKWKLAYLYLSMDDTKAQFIRLVRACYDSYFADEWDRLRLLQEASIQQLGTIQNRRGVLQRFPYLTGTFVEDVGTTLVAAPSVFYHVDTFSSYHDQGSPLVITVYGTHYADRSQPDTAEALKILADETRIKIIKTLSAGPCFGFELAQRLNLSSSTISHHVALLSSVGVVTPTRQENRVSYELNRSELSRLMASLASALGS